MSPMLLVLAVLLPLIAGLVFPNVLKGLRLRIALVCVYAAELLLVILAAVYVNGSVLIWRFADPLAITFSSDGVSKLFSCLFAGIWLLVGAYSFDYMLKEHNEKRFFRYYTLTLGALMGVCFADNLMTFMLCFEGVTLLALPLILHAEDPEARAAGLKYLGFSIFGAALALVGMFFLNTYGAGLDFRAGGILDPARAQGNENLLEGLYVLMCVGFGAKAGLFPLHSWLPAAHPVAPSPASAVLSGVITKCGVLGILRTTYYLFGMDFLRGSWAQNTMLILALITVFMGSMMAVRETLIKKRLAYSSVSQISYALFGLFLMNDAGFTGALTQVVFHSIAKDALFLWAGAVILRTGYKYTTELRGIGRTMPRAMWCYTLASLSLVGIPPLSGFVSKWYLAIGSLESPFIGVWGPVVLIVSALLTAAYLLPTCARAFFPGKDFVPASPGKNEPSTLMLYPMIALALAALLFGLFPGGLVSTIQSILSVLP